jgi:Archaeal flagella assembly protein J
MGDAYIAMLFSASLVGIIIMISVAIYSPQGIESTLNMSYMIILVISFFGLGIMYKSVPEDERTHHMGVWESREQGIIHRMERMILPLIVITCVLLFFIGSTFGVIFLLAGVLLAPLGLIGYIDDANIIRRDRDFSTFIRGLGAIMGGKGITTIYAMAELDRESLPHLKPHIDAVYSKTQSGSQ